MPPAPPGVRLSRRERMWRVALAGGLSLATASPRAIHGAQDPSLPLRATLDFPLGLALGPDEAIYVSDRRGHRVIRADLAAGTVVTVAGTGEPGYSGDGGPATAARLRCPDSIDLDAEGNLFIADRCNERVRRVDATTGIIRTVAGNGRRGASEDGPALDRSLMGPYYVRALSPRRLLITDTDSHRVRRIDLDLGRIVTLAGSGTGGFCGDGGPSREACLRRPHVALVTADGSLVIGDSFNQRIRIVEHGPGAIHTIAGNGELGIAPDSTPALEAPFSYFGAMLELPGGDLLFTEWVGGRVLRLDRNRGLVRVIAGTARDDAPTADGHDPRDTRFGPLAGLAIDAQGRLLVVAAEQGAVRRIDLTRGVVETVVGRAP